jgi:hypothetical protein
VFRSAETTSKWIIIPLGFITAERDGYFSAPITKTKAFEFNGFLG